MKIHYCITLPAIILTIILALVSAASAESARSLVQKGNMAYEQGDFDGALQYYDQAAAKVPESPYVHFDRGNALYKKGDFSGALAAYEQAQANSRTSQFLAKTKLNMGNTLVRQAEGLQEADPGAALDMLQGGVSNYRAALELDSQLIDAGRNMEVAKLRMWQLKRKIEQQQQQQKAAEQQKQEMSKELEEMIDQQKDLAQKSKEQAAKQKFGQDAAGQMAEQQQDLQEKTEELAKKMKDAGSGQGEAAQGMDKAAESLEEAIKNQQAAASELQRQQPGDAASSQDKAAEQLQDAFDSLAGNDKEKDEQQEKKEGQQGKKNDKKGQDQQNQGGKPEEKRDFQAQPAPADQTAADILNDEKQNKLRRQHRATTGYQEVEKDW